MSPVSQVGLLLVNTLGSLLLLIIVLRFLLQLVRADFYNPLSQFIVKATNPVLLPLRQLVPNIAGIDTAAIVLAVIVQYIFMCGLLVLAGNGAALPWLNIVAWAAIAVVALVLNIYFWGLIITVIASWIAPNSYNPALILINQLLEPVVRPIRKAMPDMGGLDLSPIVIFLLIQMIEILFIRPMAAAAGMPKTLQIMVL